MRAERGGMGYKMMYILYAGQADDLSDVYAVDLEI